MEPSLYDLLADTQIEKRKGAVTINRKYGRLFIDNSVKYCINPEYFEKNSKLKKVVYSVIKNAFKYHTYKGKENIEIFLNSEDEADMVKRVKDELEETYCFRGTDAGFYEMPFLGEAVDFSTKNLSIKVMPASLIKGYF